MKALKIGCGALLVVLGLLALAFCVVLIGPGFSPPTPPILEHVTFSGGWWTGGCPLHEDYPFRAQFTGGESQSPQLISRLNSLAPAGSSASTLREFLLQQGFADEPPCTTDPSIHRAVFAQSGRRFLSFPLHAEVAWKTDGDKVVWVKGIAYGLGP